MAIWPAGKSRTATRLLSQDWAKTSLGPIETWPPRLRAQIELVVDATQPMYVALGPDLLFVYNDAYEPVIGRRGPDAFGRPMREVFFDIWLELEALFAATMAGQAQLVENTRISTPWRPDRPEGFFTFSLVPIRDESGGISGFTASLFETTDVVQLQQEVAESERRFREFALVTSDVVYRMSPDWSRMWELRGKGFLADTPTPTGTWMDTYMHPDDQAAVREAIEQAIAAKSIFELEHRVLGANGELVWTLSRAMPVLDEQSNIREWLGAASDVTTRRIAEDALRKSEAALASELADTALLRNLALKLVKDGGEREIYEETLDAAIAITRAQAGTVQVYEPETNSLTLLVTRNFDREMTHHFDRVDAASTTVCGVALRTGKRTFIELDAETDDDSRRHVEAGYHSALATPLLSRSGAPIGMLNTHWSETRHRPSERELRSLDLLARQAADMIEQRQAEKALRESEERRELALAATNVGTFAWHVQEDYGEPDTRMLALFDQPPQNGLTLRDALATLIHPEDAPSYAAAVAEAVRFDGSRDLHHDMRVRRSGGGWRWVSVQGRVSFDQDGRPTRMAGAALDVTERKQQEERQSFLIQLSDALRAEADPENVGVKAVELMAARLSLDRFYLVTVDARGENIAVTHEARRPGMPPLRGTYRASDFSGPMKQIFENTIFYNDIRTDPRLSDQDRASLTGMGAVGFAGIPIRRGTEAMIWAAGAISAQPRAWTADDIALLENATERIWAAVNRAQAQQKLQQSEARFQQFANASSGALWIRDAATLKMEYVSPAITRVYGVDPETFLNGLEVWASSIVPEDREVALAHIEQARQGEAVVHEFRIQRATDHAFRWIRNIDFPLYDARGEIERIGGIAEDVTEARLAVEHQGVLLAELQHRVRNIMAMIRSMALRSADGATDVEDYRSLLQGRLMALARVQVLLTRQANAGGSLRDTIESEVAAQAHSGSQFELSGPDIRLSPKAVEVLTLAFHELATNALKYGAFSTPDGYLRVSWHPFEKRGRPWLELDWTEEGAPPRPPSSRRGFGSDLIEGRIPYELGGVGKVTIQPGGAHCRLEFPLKDGESILETDAPTPTIVFGGVLDMTDAPSLAGRRVLVVEDDYYLAGDAAAALRGAGAEVLGPCPSEDAAANLLEEETPTHAVLDLNLGGGGPRFEIARAMKTRGVPFVFITGYDPDVIPPEFSDVTRLQKPVPFRSLVEAVSRL